MSTRIERIRRLITWAETHAATNSGQSEVGCISVIYGYAHGSEGNKDDIVVLGNWNTITRWSGKKHEDVDDIMPRLGQALERLGASIEWSDQYAECSQCYRAVRTCADSYSWVPQYWESDNGTVCQDCVQEDPDEYIEHLIEKHAVCTLDELDLDILGYVRLEMDDLERGFHRGQDADPRVINKHLLDRGITQFFYEVTETSQFYSKFVVRVHKDQAEAAQALWGTFDTDGTSPSKNLEQALRNVPIASSQPGKIVVSHIDVDTGVISTDELTPQEFVEGVRT